MALYNFPVSRAKRFELLIRPLLSQLYRQAYRLCNHRQNAEDLVQDLLTRLYEQNHPLDDLENIKTWLLKALYHQFVDNYRKLKPERQVDSGAAAEAALLSIPCPLGSAEEVTARLIEQRRLQQAIQSLSSEHHAIVVLHDMEGYTLAELEPVLEVPLGTLKSRLHRARQQLRETLLKEPLAGTLRVLHERVK